MVGLAVAVVVMVTISPRAGAHSRWLHGGVVAVATVAAAAAVAGAEGGCAGLGAPVSPGLSRCCRGLLVAVPARLSR